MNFRVGISAPIAISIVVAIGVAISITYALWVAGVMGQAGYGTKPIKLGIADFRVVGPYTMILIQNLGSDTVYVDDIMLNNYVMKPLTAFEYNTMENRLELTGKSWLIEVKPGELVEVWLESKSITQLKPGVDYSVNIHTVNGFKATKIIKAERWMLVPTTLDIYIRNRDTTYEVDFGRMTYKVFKGTPQNPGKIICNGSMKFLETDGVFISKDPSLKDAPLIVVRNPYAGKRNFILFVDHNYVSYEYGSGYYNLSVIKDAVPFLDFMVLFEDQWSSPGIAGDADYNELVTRVTWVKEGYAVVTEYFSAHGYTFDVYVGGKYVFSEQGNYWNICNNAYDGKYGTDDLRCSLPGRTFKVIP